MVDNLHLARYIQEGWFVSIDLSVPVNMTCIPLLAKTFRVAIKSLSTSLELILINYDA